MSSSANIRCGGNCDLLNRSFGGSNVPIPMNNQYSPIPRRIRLPKTAISAISTLSTSDSHSIRSAAAPIRLFDQRDGGEAVVHEKLDEWMRSSVVDIVKNLREAPLMVHVYGGGAVVEKAVGWADAKGRWEAGESPVPEGLIFVEELSEQQVGDENDVGEERNDYNDGVTRAFGLVVQGKGDECFPVCYLLKTSTAGFGSGFGCGLGLGCTHFCLVRVNGFRETTESQLKNCWLLQAQAQAQFWPNFHGP